MARCALSSTKRLSADRIRFKLEQAPRVAHLGPNMLERLVQQLAALALVESGNRPLQGIGDQPGLRKSAKRAARLRPEGRHTAGPLAAPERGRRLIEEFLECGSRAREREPMRLRCGHVFRRQGAQGLRQDRTRRCAPAFAGIGAAEDALARRDPASAAASPRRIAIAIAPPTRSLHTAAAAGWAAEGSGRAAAASAPRCIRRSTSHRSEAMDRAVARSPRSRVRRSASETPYRGRRAAEYSRRTGASEFRTSDRRSRAPPAIHEIAPPIGTRRSTNDGAAPRGLLRRPRSTATPSG